MSTKQIPLGARVRYTAVYMRVATYDDPHSWRRPGHTWTRIEVVASEGIFMGYRMKQSGVWTTDTDGGYGSSASYWEERGRRTKVALVVTDAWCGPLTVDPTTLEVIEPVSEALVRQACTEMSDYEDACLPEQLIRRIQHMLRSHAELRAQALDGFASGVDQPPGNASSETRP